MVQMQPKWLKCRYLVQMQKPSPNARNVVEMQEGWSKCKKYGATEDSPHARDIAQMQEP